MLQKEKLDQKLKALSKSKILSETRVYQQKIMQTEDSPTAMCLYSDNESVAKEGGDEEVEEKKEEVEEVQPLPVKKKRTKMPGHIHDLNPVRPYEPPVNSSSLTSETTVSSKGKPTKEKPLTEYQIKEYQMKRFQRERKGKYELIFPFNAHSEELAIQLNKQTSGNGAVGVTGPSHANHMKALV